MNRLLTLAVLLGSWSALHATIITNVLTVSGLPGPTNNYSNAPIIATQCFVGFCPGQNVPGPGPSYQVSDPLTLRMTNFSLQCPFANCLGFGFSPNADFTLPVAGSADVSIHIDGTAPANFPGLDLFIVIQGNSFNFAPQNVHVPVDGLGNFSLNMGLGSISWSAGEVMKIVPNISAENMTLGQTVLMPSSFDVTLTSTATPEPATFLWTISALLCLFTARRRFARCRR